jgi:putative ABC transport system permease protein
VGQASSLTVGVRLESLTHRSFVVPFREDRPVRLADILGIALSALYQQKVRTLLTTLGVVIGTFILVVSLAIGQGVEQVVRHEFGRNDQLRQIQVHTSYRVREANIPPEELVVKGSMSEAKRERLRKALIRWWSRRNARRPGVPLNEERLRALAALDHVQSVVPFIFQGGRVFFHDQSREVTTCAATARNRNLPARLVAGAFFQSDRDSAVVVHEYLLYLWGITGDDDVQQVVGQTLRLEFHLGRRPPAMLLTLIHGSHGQLTSEEDKVLDKAVKQLPAALEHLDLTPAEKATLTRVLKKPPPTTVKPVPEVTVTADFTITGVIREFTDKDPTSGLGLLPFNQDADVYLPVQTAKDLLGHAPQYMENGFDSVTITVDREEHVKAVVQAIKAMGLQEYSLVEIFERVRRNIVLMTFATGFVAAMALLVAALGITNTMVMGVLERTREIGVMKAVGARDGHIQLIFLVEGALIGVFGGGLGLLAGWLTSFPGDAMARKVVESEGMTQLEESLFVFPLWLTLGVLVVATFIATLAAVYPARRAARVNPITALRHE